MRVNSTVDSSMSHASNYTFRGFNNHMLRLSENLGFWKIFKTAPTWTFEHAKDITFIYSLYSLATKKSVVFMASFVNASQTKMSPSNGIFSRIHARQFFFHGTFWERGSLQTLGHHVDTCDLETLALQNGQYTTLTRRKYYKKMEIFLFFLVLWGK